MRDGKPTDEIEKKIDKIISVINQKTGASMYRDNDENSQVNKIKSAYENDCIVLERNGFQNHKSFTTYEFYNRLDFLKRNAPKK